MMQIVPHRSLSWVIACSDGMRWERGDTGHGWLFKSGFEKPVRWETRTVVKFGA